MIRIWLALAVMNVRIDAFFDETDKECTDKSPYCNTNDCTVRPGYALEYCRKTCGDCEPFCQNSHFVSCKDSRKPECDSMLKDYCPLLCGACRPIKKKSEKKIGAKSTSRTPLTFGELLKSAVAIPDTVQEGHKPNTSAPESPADHSFTSGNSVQEEEFAVHSSLHRPASENKQSPLGHQESPEIGSIVKEYDDELVLNPYTDSDTALNLNSSDFVLPPEPVRLSPRSNFGFRPHPSAWQPPPVGLTSVGPNFPLPSYPFSPPVQHQSQFFPKVTLPPPGIYAPLSPQGVQPYLSYLPPVGGPVGNLYGQPLALPDLITLLGCRDKDPAICSKLTIESCLSRPGFYMKLCPVRCKNCNGLQCLDSVKIDCGEVRRLGGCKLPMAAEYCPRSCRLCATPPSLADSLPPCKDELETCADLAESGVCEHPYSRDTMRIYCAMSCEFCRHPQYYMNDVYRKSTAKSKMPLSPSSAKNYPR